MTYREHVPSLAAQREARRRSIERAVDFGIALACLFLFGYFLAGCATVPPARACEVATIAAASATVDTCTRAYETATAEELIALDTFCLIAARKLIELRDEGGAVEACEGAK